jgi:hypothetical protein
VEVAADERRIGVRDTKQNKTGPVLEFAAGTWRSFIARRCSRSWDAR